MSSRFRHCSLLKMHAHFITFLLAHIIGYCRCLFFMHSSGSWNVYFPYNLGHFLPAQHITVTVNSFQLLSGMVWLSELRHIHVSSLDISNRNAIVTTGGMLLMWNIRHTHLLSTVLMVGVNKICSDFIYLEECFIHAENKIPI